MLKKATMVFRGYNGRLAEFVEGLVNTAEISTVIPHYDRTAGEQAMVKVTMKSGESLICEGRPSDFLVDAAPNQAEV